MILHVIVLVRTFNFNSTIMWPFRKTITFARSGILKGMTDCHSHLLPGEHDAVGTLDESLRILDMMEKHGVRKVWLTPHIMEDIPNETVT